MDGGLEGSITSYALTVQASDGTNAETVTVEITVTPPIIVPAVEILAQTSSMEAGQSAGMRVRAFDLDTAESYAIRVKTDGATLGFDTGCTDQEEPVTVPEGRRPTRWPSPCTVAPYRRPRLQPRCLRERRRWVPPAWL